MLSDEFFIYRRDLPHWRLSGATYFVTFRRHAQQPDLRFGERTVVVQVLRGNDEPRYRLDAYVVMNDHVHALVEPLGNWRLESIVQSWKSISATRLQREWSRSGAVWQREYFDRIIRSEQEWWEKLRYIAHNPMKRWPAAHDYEWVQPKV